MKKILFFVLFGLCGVIANNIGPWEYSKNIGPWQTDSIACTPPTITAPAAQIDTAKVTDTIQLTLGGGTCDSVTGVSLPAWMTLTKTGANIGRVIVAPTDSVNKTGYQFIAWGCSNDTTFDSITVTWGDVILTSVSPDTVFAGDTATILGRGFKSTQGTSTFAWGDSTPTIAKWVNDTIKAICPNMDTGFYTFTASNGTMSDTMPDSIYVAQCTRDTIVASGKWSNASIWADGTPPGVNDTVYKINNGTFNDTLNANYTICAFICDTLTAGAHIRTGYILEVTGAGINYSDRGSGVRNYGLKTKISGAGSSQYFSAVAGTVAASLCTLHIAANCSTNFMDAIDWNKLRIDTKDTFKFAGTGAQTFNSATTPLVIGDSAKFFARSVVAASFRRSTSGKFIENGAGSIHTIGNFTLFQSASGIKCTVPNFECDAVLNGLYTGQLATYAAACTTVFSGYVKLPIASTTAILNITDAASNTPSSIYFSSDSITCYKLVIRGIATVPVKNVYFGNAKIRLGAGGIVGLAMTSTSEYMYLQNSTIVSAGPITLWSGLNWDAGASKITTNGTVSITSAGKAFYDLTDSLGALTFADSATILDDFTSLSGNSSALTWSGYGMYCGGDMSLNNTGTINMGNSVRFPNASSLLSIASGTGTITATSCNIFSSGASFTTAINKYVRFKNAVFTAKSDATIGGTFDSLRLNKITLADSAGVKIQATKKLVLDSIGDIEGSAGKLCRVQSTSAASAFTLTMPIDTVSYVYFKDVTATNTIYAIDGTSVDGGGNTNIEFPSAAGGSATSNQWNSRQNVIGIIISQ